MKNPSTLVKDADLDPSVPSERGSRAWFWWLTSVLLVNAALAFAYHFLDANPAASARADAPALVVAPHSITVSATPTAPTPTTTAMPTVVTPAPATCWVWGPFSNTQAEAFNTQAQSASLPAAQGQPTQITASHVISMGPYPTAQL